MISSQSLYQTQDSVATLRLQPLSLALSFLSPISAWRLEADSDRSSSLDKGSQAHAQPARRYYIVLVCRKI